MNEALNRDHLRTFLAVIGTATILLGASYTMVQQATRLSANDTPTALSQTVKNELDSGSSPNDVITSQMVDVASNTNPFIIITDDTKHVLASTARLDGQTPLPPQGVFDYTATHDTDHFTWQPADNVRLATRVVAYGTKGKDAGFIITGQSLQPYEDRINVYGELGLVAWFAILAWNLLILIFSERKYKASK